MKNSAYFLLCLWLLSSSAVLAMKPSQKHFLGELDSNFVLRHSLSGHNTTVSIDYCWGEQQETAEDQTTNKNYSLDDHKRHAVMSWYDVPRNKLIKKISTELGFWYRGGAIKHHNNRDIPYIMLIATKEPSSGRLLNMDTGEYSYLEKAGTHDYETYRLSSWRAGISSTLDYITMLLFNAKTGAPTVILYHKNEKNNYNIKARIDTTAWSPKLSFSIKENYFCVGTMRNSTFYDPQTGEEKEQTLIPNLYYSNNSEHLYNNQIVYDENLKELIRMSDKEEPQLQAVQIIDKDKPTIRYLINNWKEHTLMLYTKSKPIKEDETKKEEDTQGIRLILPEKISHVHASMNGDYCFVVPSAKRNSQEHNTLYIYDVRTNLLEGACTDTHENEYEQQGEWLLSEESLIKIDDKKEETKGGICVIL